MNTVEITYVVGAGPYPYRADGRRMSRHEAVAYLVEVHGMGLLAADRLLDMHTTQAVRDAGRPRVDRVVVGSGSEYRINGADPRPRTQARQHLIQEWRLTPGEAAQALDHATSDMR